jgi:hypothetical protein
MIGRRKKDNSTFLKGATRGTPGKRLTKWQKKPHIHRALIRAVVFWPIAGITALAIFNVQDALLALAFSALPLTYFAVVKGRRIFFDPFTTTDAANGVRTQHWTIKPKWLRLIRRQEIAGMVTRKTRIDPDLPPDIERAIREELNRDLKGGDLPITSVRPYRRKGSGTK